MLESLWWVSVIFTVFANFFIAYIVIKNNSRSATNILLTIITVVLLLWDVTNFFALSPGSEASRLFWVRSVMFVTAPLGPLLYLLSSTFPGEKLKTGRTKVLYIIMFNILIMILSFSPWMFTKLENQAGGGFKLYPGPAIILYGLNLMGFLTISFAKLIKEYRKNSGVLKKQIGLFMFGTIISFSLMTATNFVAVVVFKSIKYTFLGPSFTLIMVGFIAYAIVRHKLLNIKLIATEALSTVIVLVLLVKLFFYNSLTVFVLDIVVFTIVLIFSYFLVKSVSKEVEQKEKLQILTGKLKELDKQKDEFVSVAAHELRAPMTAIKGYLSMIKEGDAGKISPKVSEFISDASEGSDRLIRLVNNMLNVGRIEEGRMVYQMDYVRLTKVAQNAFDAFSEEASRMKLKFDLKIDKNISDLVFVDKDRIHEIIINLVSNAIKYTEKGNVQIKLSNKNEGKVLCEIIDTGRGISEEEQEKLFKKFERTKSSTGKTLGTGLGLYISKLLVEKFDGEIGITSKEGEGSNFWFELPIAKINLKK